MLDSEFAELYQVETFNLNKAVKRNLHRVPGDFTFQLTKQEAAFAITNPLRFWLTPNDLDVYYSESTLDRYGEPMAFCPNCGAQADGRFCPKCGTPLPADTGGGAGPTPTPATPVQSSGMTDNMAAALCYLLTFLTGILFLVLEPYNKNKTIRFHAFQAIFFGVAVIALSFVGSILTVAFMGVPMIGALFALLFHTVLWLGCFILWVLLMYKAYNNEKFVLPIIGPLAEKQA